jgi:hypothetical protein
MPQPWRLIFGYLAPQKRHALPAVTDALLALAQDDHSFALAASGADWHYL